MDDDADWVFGPVMFPVGAQCTVSESLTGDELPAIGFLDQGGKEVFFALPRPMLVGLMEQMVEVCERLWPEALGLNSD